VEGARLVVDLQYQAYHGLAYQAVATEGGDGCDVEETGDRSKPWQPKEEMDAIPQFDAGHPDCRVKLRRIIHLQQQFQRKRRPATSAAKEPKMTRLAGPLAARGWLAVVVVPGAPAWV